MIFLKFLDIQYWLVSNNFIITQDMKRLVPKKGEYRMRAHMNPFNKTTYPYPVDRNYVDWSKHFPNRFGRQDHQSTLPYCNTNQYASCYDDKVTIPLEKLVTIIDIGCGYGGLLFALAPVFPHHIIMGLQIRHKLVNYVACKICGFRVKYPGEYGNVGVVRTNTMRHLCQYYKKQSLEKIFICFPDPISKKRHIGESQALASFFEFISIEASRKIILRLSHLRTHQMFTQALESDICVCLMLNKTEQSKKAQKKNEILSVFWKMLVFSAFDIIYSICFKSTKILKQSLSFLMINSQLQIQVSKVSLNTFLNPIIIVLSFG